MGEVGEFSGDRAYWQERGLLSSSGKPRLAYAREYFLGREDPDLEELTRLYRGWRDLVEYGVMQKQTWTGYDVEKKTIAVRCSKRGNEVYRARTRRRFGVLLNREDTEFFPFSEANPKVSLVFVTLTWAAGDIRDSWENNGKTFNRWITNLRQRFGRLSYVRAWEAFKNGCCHVHLMIQFHEQKLLAFKTIDQEGKFVWRISQKAEFEKSWPAFVDVRAVRTYSAVVRYLQKRILRGTDKGDQQAGDLTFSLLWIFRKRAFALSRDLAVRLADLIQTLHNSKSQATLTGGFLEVKWVWLGVFSASELELTSDQAASWTIVLDHPPPDPQAPWGP